MKTRNAEAIRLEDDYMRRLAEATRSCDHEDAEEIRQGVKEHIEEAVNATGTQEVNLVEMAEVLERLGAPGAYAREAAASESERHPSAPALPPPIGGGQSHTQLAEDRAAWQAFLSKLWIAKLIGVIGVFIPVIDFYICGIISTIMMMFALKADIVRTSREFQGCKVLVLALLVVMCISPLTSILSLVHPLLAILDLPVALGHLVLGLVFYWRVMAGLGELATQYGKDSVAKSIYSVRTIYIALTLGMLALATAVAFFIALAIRPDRREQVVMEIAIAFLALPVTWLIGWFFSLRPVSMTNRALD